MVVHKCRICDRVITSAQVIEDDALCCPCYGKKMAGELNDEVRVLRLIEYRGPRDQMEDQIARSIQGSRSYGKMTITAITLGEFPLQEILNREENRTDGKDNPNESEEPVGRKEKVDEEIDQENIDDWNCGY